MGLKSSLMPTQVVDNGNRRGAARRADTPKPRAADLLECKCGLCGHQSRESCIIGKCSCCDLEDMFSLLSKQEFAP